MKNLTDLLIENAALVKRNAELVEALEDLLGSVDTGGDRSRAACHVGICTAAECCNCSRIFKARAALENNK